MNMLFVIIMCLICYESSTLKAQDNLNALLDMVEIGKTYALYKAKANDKDVTTSNEMHYIHLVPPIYRTISDTIEISPALNGNLDTSNYFIQTEILVLKEPGAAWKTATISPKCRPQKNIPHVALCLLKTTPEYKIIHRKFFASQIIYDTSSTDYVIPAQFMVVKRKVLQQKARIYYSKYPQSVNKVAGEKRIAIPAGYWSSWEEITCPFGEFNYPSVIEIQTALRKKNYPVKLTNKFDEQTKSNLLRFQQDNKLPEEGLTEQTLQRLGINHPPLISVDF